MAAKKKAKFIDARVTYLEMNQRPVRQMPLPSRPPIALLQAKHMPVSYYRYLYGQIGQAHHWYERREMDDSILAAIIHADTTDIHVLYANGSPAGFFEINSALQPKSVELAYFGLAPDFQGLGLGKWFLHSAIQAAWNMDPEKITVHTNSLDHPAALGLYQKMGFEAVGISEEKIKILD